MKKKRSELFKNKTPEYVFNEIYNTNAWSSLESVSGSGSSLKLTQNLRKKLPDICKNYNIKRVLDVACGDLNWTQEILNKFEYYHGIDIVDEIIQKNIDYFYKPGKVEFSTQNIVNMDKLNNDKKYDAIIAKDLLQHFPTEYVIKALELFKNSGIKWLFLTHFPSLEQNRDIESFGLWRPINFKNKPYNMRSPLVSIKEDNYVYENFKDKSLSLWRIN